MQTNPTIFPKPGDLIKLHKPFVTDKWDVYPVSYFTIPAGEILFYLGNTYNDNPHDLRGTYVYKFFWQDRLYQSQPTDLIPPIYWRMFKGLGWEFAMK